ncbi:hypothetical protein D7X96_03575 [Corallococcus interemptor]|uniref:Uncharacterized protein n=1 Tax=Corallococcus interemptor TaxID=2316720 RepID=A0A3A8QYB6_9BACT|nr:hypothetical protein [Corallococcus interemptor]RKH72761.1 hypothetical protein D7X96_03575 [Corallococcus interemptor]
MFRRSLRALTLSSFAMGGLLMAAPAHADEPREAPATILDVSLVDGELTARILWAQDAKSLPGEVEVVSHDGQDTLTAGERVTPKAGEVSEVTLYGAVKEPWETGWAQRLAVLGAKGQELTHQPYDVSLDCEDEKTCALKATAGVSASREVLHVSRALKDTLDTIEKDLGAKEFDLVREVARRDPTLYGEALSYAHGLSKLGPVGPAEGCRCTWQASSTRSNTSGTSLGAAHNLYAGPLAPNRRSNARLTTQGTSRINLTLNCTSLASIHFQQVGIKQSGGLVKPVLMPQPVYSMCAGTCSGRFNHFGRIIGNASANSTTMLLNGTATEQIKYHLGNSLSPLLNQTVHAPANSGFDVSTIANNTSSGSGFVQTSGEAFYTYNGDPSLGLPFGQAQAAYAMAIRGYAVCPGGGLNPSGTVSDFATTMNNQSSLDQNIRDFFLYGL